MEDQLGSRCRVLVWHEDGVVRRARWLSATAPLPPGRVLVVRDDLSADRAIRHARDRTSLLWRGDHRNARQLLDAMKRRTVPRVTRHQAPAEAFRRHRQAMAYRARVLGALLVELDADYRIPLAHAPDVRQACREAYGPPDGAGVVSLQELLGVVGAGEWRRRGMEVPALGTRIHPYYGVFAPTRREYVELVARAPLPPVARAFDIGTGTGVLALVLARRGVAEVVGTDTNPAAVACARENVARLGLDARVAVHCVDLFPPGRADLVVCNPPWLPGRAVSAIETGVFDAGGRMLRRFVLGLPDHLADGGEAWLVMSDLAEQLGLRTRTDLLDLLTLAKLTVRDRLDAPRPSRRAPAGDVLAAARARETVSLWRLAH